MAYEMSSGVAGLSADPESMAKRGKEVEEYADELLREKNKLTGKVEELHGLWTGNASDSFHGHYTEDFEPLFDGFIGKLNEYGINVGGSANIFDKVEQDQVAQADHLFNKF